MYVCLLAFLCLKVPFTHQYTSMGGFPPLYLGQLTETHPYLPFLCLSPSLSPSLPLSLRFLSLLTLTQCRTAADSRFFIFYKCFTPSFTMMQKSMLFSYIYHATPDNVFLKKKKILNLEKSTFRTLTKSIPNLHSTLKGIFIPTFPVFTLLYS